MKNILLGLALAASSLVPGTAAAADGLVHIKGQLKGLTDSLFVFIPQGERDHKQDTVLVKDGKFDFTVSVDRPSVITVCTPEFLRQEGGGSFQMIAVPGESAELSGDVTANYYLTGSKFYREFNEADRAMEAAGKPFSDFYASLNKRMEAGESQETLMNEFQEKAPALRQQKADGIMAFIKQHPDYEASAAIIPELGELEQMKAAALLLSPAVREGRMKHFYQGIIDHMEAQEKAEAEAAKKQAAGVEAPYFTLNDIEGKPLTLSSLRGKYVILDFWGSWCGWCIKGFPEMKAYYEKYKGKFEILGIDCNDTEAKWKAAVEKHALPWLHVYNPQDGKVLADYGIQGFPTKIILDPAGKIVKTVVGEDPAFYTFLDETFGNK